MTRINQIWASDFWKFGLIMRIFIGAITQIIELHKNALTEHLMTIQLSESSIDPAGF